MFRFKPEHFAHVTCCDYHGDERISHEANRLLDEHVKTLPEVYGTPSNEFAGMQWDRRILNGLNGTHRARLWNVEPIKKCEHRVTVSTSTIWKRVEVDAFMSECDLCGKDMVATWSEA